MRDGLVLVPALKIHLQPVWFRIQLVWFCRSALKVQAQLV